MVQSSRRTRPGPPLGRRRRRRAFERSNDRSIDRSIDRHSRSRGYKVKHPPRRPSSCLPLRARSRAPSTSRLRDRDRRRRRRRRPAPRRATSGCPEAPGRSTSTEPPQGACERTRASTISRDASSVCVFFLNRDSSVSTREEGVDTFGRRSIGIGDRVVGWMSRSSRMFDRAGSDRVKNRRRRVDEHSTNRRRGCRWTSNGRPRSSVVASGDADERTNGWMDGCALEDTRR